MNCNILLMLLSLACKSFLEVKAMNWAKSITTDKSPLMEPTALIGLGGFNKFCFGALIDLKWVITLASCVTKKDETTQKIIIHQPVRVKLGFTKKRSDRPMFIETLKPESIFVHPKYNFKLNNDVALLRLPDGKINEVEGFIKIAKLPQEPSDYVYENTTVVILGIGTTENFGGFKPPANNPLKNVSVFFSSANFKITSGALCVRTFETPEDTVSIDNMCGLPIREEVLTSITEADSGAPVFLSEAKDKTQYLIGLGQKALPIGEWVVTPALYVRLVSFKRWIKKVTGISS